MNEDVQVFYEADGGKRVFVFDLPEASVTLSIQNSEEGAEQAGLLVANFQNLLMRAMQGLKEN